MFTFLLLLPGLMTGPALAGGYSFLSGPLWSADGTAAAPQYSFAADENTGIYSCGADCLGFSAAGALGLQVDGTGAVVPSGKTLAVTSTLQMGAASTLAFTTGGQISGNIAGTPTWSGSHTFLDTLTVNTGTNNTVIALTGSDYQWEIYRDYSDNAQLKFKYVQGGYDTLVSGRDGSLQVGPSTGTLIADFQTSAITLNKPVLLSGHTAFTPISTLPYIGGKTGNVSLSTSSILPTILSSGSYFSGSSWYNTTANVKGVNLKVQGGTGTGSAALLLTNSNAASFTHSADSAYTEQTLLQVTHAGAVTLGSSTSTTTFKPAHTVYTQPLEWRSLATSVAGGGPAADDLAYIRWTNRANANKWVYGVSEIRGGGSEASPAVYWYSYDAAAAVGTISPNGNWWHYGYTALGDNPGSAEGQHPYLKKIKCEGTLPASAGTVALCDLDSYGITVSQVRSIYGIVFDNSGVAWAVSSSSSTGDPTYLYVLNSDNVVYAGTERSLFFGDSIKVLIEYEQ